MVTPPVTVEEESIRELQMDSKLEGSESAAVFEVIGEPAIIINGVPPLPSESAVSAQMSDTGGNDDPLLSEWLEGREIRKLFGDQYYSGKVDKYDEEEKWYRVTYEDGDFEDLEWRELEEVLVPIDISIPLTRLALRQYKVGGDASLTKMNSARKKRGRAKSVESKRKTHKLVLSSETHIMVAEKLEEIILNTKQNMEHNSLVPKIHAESGDNISKPDNSDSRKSTISMKTMELLPILCDAELTVCDAELTGSIPVTVLANEEIVAEEATTRQQ